MNYILHILIMLEIYILLALSLNLQVGFTGLLSLAQAVFYGVGAYSCALLMTKFGIPFFAALGIAIIIGILFSFIVGFFASRLRDLYFALATLALQIIFFSLNYNWIGLTNGPYGIAGIPKPSIAGFEINSLVSFFVMGLIFLSLSLIFFKWFQKTPLCRMMQATRDDQVAVVALGKNPTYFKTVSIAVASVFATIAGALYATYITYIDPTSFTLDESILILSIILIGGSGNIIGPVSGALLYILLPEALKFISIPDAIAANLRMILFGLALILVIRFKPNGFFGKYAMK